MNLNLTELKNHCDIFAEVKKLSGVENNALLLQDSKSCSKSNIKLTFKNFCTDTLPIHEHVKHRSNQPTECSNSGACARTIETLRKLVYQCLSPRRVRTRYIYLPGRTRLTSSYLPGSCCWRNITYNTHASVYPPPRVRRAAVHTRVSTGCSAFFR